MPELIEAIRKLVEQFNAAMAAGIVMVLMVTFAVALGKRRG